MDTLVTPEMAKKWIDKNNNNNRNIVDRVVTMYANDMAKGNWTYTGDPIQFGEDGELQNGQHRLLAVIKSGVDTRFNVIEGLPLTARKYMDLQRKRTVGDILTLDGVVNGKKVAAVKRLEFDVTQVKQNKPPNGHTLSATDLVKGVEADPNIIWVVNSATLPIPSKLGNRTAIQYCYLAFHRIDPYACAEFFGKLVTPSNMTDNSPIMTLHKRLTYASWSNVGLKLRLQQTAVISLAWNAWRKGENRSRLQVFLPNDLKDMNIVEPV